MMLHCKTKVTLLFWSTSLLIIAAAGSLTNCQKYVLYFIHICALVYLV